jgi:hypothetical protein
MGALDGYWAKYAETLALVREQRPVTFSHLRAILDRFEPASSGDAFFPSQSADDELSDALMEIGWRIDFEEGGYVYEAYNPAGKLIFRFVEGDLYDRT